jgi:hypothetical protein
MSGTGTAERLNIRLFVEGVELPVIAVNVQVAPNSPAVASIQVPPLAEGMDLLPRSLVHVFFDDGSYVPDTTQLHQASTRPGDNQSLASDMEASGYRLLFCGELAGFQWQKQPYNRSLVLQCMDLSCYWDTAYQWVNTDLFGPGYKATFSDGATNMFNNLLSEPGEVVSATLQDGMRNGTAQYPKLKGLVGGIVRLLERIGGAYFTNGGKQYEGSNLFFSLAELRLHITQMIGAYDSDPTAQQLLGGSWDGLFGRTISNLGDHVSIRSVINALMPIIFHETYAQPSPFYQPGSCGTISGYTRTNYQDDPEFSNFAAVANQVVANIDFVSANIQSGASSKDQAALLSSMAQTCRQQANMLTTSATQSGRAKFSSAASALGSAATIASTSTGSSGKVTSSLTAARSALAAIPQLSIAQGNKSEVVPARVWSQIFRPDVWFSSPPKCNVVFPDEMTQFQYSRQFFQEPTRLLLKTNEEFYGEDELFDKLYFAPYAEGLKSSKKSLQSMLSGDIFLHELYTGILPVFEKMGEYNIFAAKTGVVNGPAGKVPAAQRATNFLYFKHRFEDRIANITMRFKPYIACGFPMLVIDSYLDENKLSQQQELLKQLGAIPIDMSKFFGAQILGNAAQVTHSTDQATGGTTSIVMNYCRKTDESVEFLGATSGTQRTQWMKSDNQALRYSTVAAISPPAAGSRGPLAGEVVSVVEVTNQVLPGDRSNPATYKQLPLFISRTSVSGNVPYVAVGVTQPVSKYGPDVIHMFDDPDMLVLFRAYQIGERIDQYTSTQSDMPIEEMIRPGWYGDCWHPGLIGEVYQQFFGISSITDPVIVTDPQGSKADYPPDTSAQQPVLMLADKTTVLKDGTVVNAVAIKDAVDFLVGVYSYVKQNDLNVADFIHAYTWRPIMNMTDMFGEASLQFKVNGRTMVATGGKEGFHSRAFGDYSDVFLLVPPEVDQMLGIRRDDNANLFAMKGDTRRDKRQAVEAYLSALTYSSAQLG